MVKRELPDDIDPRPDVLWVRGADDRTVSDTSAADFGYLGKIGLVPDWPGEEAYPPQPMVSQIRTLLDGYAADGGSYREEVFSDGCRGPRSPTPHGEWSQRVGKKSPTALSKRSPTTPVYQLVWVLV